VFDIIYSVVFSLIVVVLIQFVFIKLTKSKKIRIASLVISVLFASYLQNIYRVKLSVAKLFSLDIANELIIKHKINEFSYTPLVTKFLNENKDTDLYKEFKDIFKLGLKRLEYEDLKKWRDIKYKTLTLSDDICGKIANGEATVNDIYNYNKMLSPDDVATWMDIQIKAASLEMKRYEYFASSEKEFNRALNIILENINTEDRLKFNDVYRFKKMGSPEDLCFASKILYGKPKGLTPDLENKYLKYLASKLNEQN
jgi:hypothetical protein